MPMVAHRKRRGTDLLVLNISTRLGWVISSIPWLLYTQENLPFHTVNMARWASGLVHTSRRKRYSLPPP